jgi:enoyl-CoA hydratase/carnithine racemase
MDPDAAPAPGRPGWISLADLADGAAQAPLLDADGQVDGPLLAVDLDSPASPALLDRACRAARSSERILAGVRAAAPLDAPWRGLLAALGVTLTAPALGTRSRACVPGPAPAARAEGLRAAAQANPQAALVLAQVLRAGPGLDGPAALDMESFAYSTLLGGPEFRRWLGGQHRPSPPPAAGPPVRAERSGEQLRITLNRPERRNAYGRELRDALADALLVAVLDESVTRVIVSGAGPSFCSGGDLGEFGTTPDPATAHFLRTRSGAAALLHRVAARTEVRVHGACVGAGVELAAFAGRVSARPGSTFRLPEVGMGLIPGAGGTVSLPRRIGRWRTLDLALSGRPLDVVTAARWGLADEVAVPPGDPE